MTCALTCSAGLMRLRVHIHLLLYGAVHLPPAAIHAQPQPGRRRERRALDPGRAWVDC
jgi:hypothetical protein